MIDRDEEKVARILHYLLTRQGSRTRRAGCPDEEELANYSSGLLTEEAKQGLEAHLADCAFCLDDLVAVHKSAQDEEAERVPQGLIHKAMAQLQPVQREESFLDIVVRLVKGSLELVSTSGYLIPAPASAGIRGKPRPSDASILQVEKDIGKFKVAVEVEQMEMRLCQVVVRVSGEEGKPTEGIRLTLLSGGREQASYLTRRGETVFDRIPLGEYNLAISDSGAPVGTIRLRLME